LNEMSIDTPCAFACSRHPKLWKAQLSPRLRAAGLCRRPIQSLLWPQFAASACLGTFIRIQHRRRAATGGGVQGAPKRFNQRDKYDFRSTRLRRLKQRMAATFLAGLLLLSLVAGESFRARADVLQARLEQKEQIEYVYRETPFRNSLLAIRSRGVIVSSVEEVPSPRAIGGWVTDMAGILDEGTVKKVNAAAENIRRRTGAELAVVTLPRLDGGKKALKPFATKLFNSWGIGDRYKNNGVLVLLSVADRRVEVEIGKGLNSVFNERLTGSKDRWLNRMIDSHMLPELGMNRWSTGVLSGVDAICSKLIQVDSIVSSPEGYRQAVVLSICLSAALTVSVLAVLFGLPWQTPKCLRCEKRMSRLRDAMQDELSPGAQMEMSVGSVHYILCGCRRPGCQDTWAKTTVEASQAHRRISVRLRRSREISQLDESLRARAEDKDGLGFLKEISWLSRYSTCRACGYRTTLTSSQVVVPATYESDGLRISTSNCSFCGAASTEQQILQRLRRPSSNSSGSSSFSGGSSSGGGSGGDF